MLVRIALISGSANAALTSRARSTGLDQVRVLGYSTAWTPYWLSRRRIPSSYGAG